MDEPFTRRAERGIYAMAQLSPSHWIALTAAGKFPQARTSCYSVQALWVILIFRVKKTSRILEVCVQAVISTLSRQEAWSWRPMAPQSVIAATKCVPGLPCARNPPRKLSNLFKPVACNSPIFAPEFIRESLFKQTTQHNAGCDSDPGNSNPCLGLFGTGFPLCFGAVAA